MNFPNPAISSYLLTTPVTTQCTFQITSNKKISRNKRVGDLTLPLVDEILSREKRVHSNSLSPNNLKQRGCVQTAELTVLHCKETTMVWRFFCITPWENNPSKIQTHRELMKELLWFPHPIHLSHPSPVRLILLLSAQSSKGDSSSGMKWHKAVRLEVLSDSPSYHPAKGLDDGGRNAHRQNLKCCNSICRRCS